MAAVCINLNGSKEINLLPVLKGTYGRSSFLVHHNSFPLDINQVKKNKSLICIFFKHKQNKYTGSLSLVPMAAAAASVGGEEENILRRVKDHRPSLWSDSSISIDNEVHERYTDAIVVLKEEVRSMVMAKDSTLKEKMMLIDTVERLGVAYHFEQEIEEQIGQIFKFHAKYEEGEYHDLFTTALHFRLLRQHGYHVPSSVFDKFKDKDKKFKKTLTSDVCGLLSLYEASHLRYSCGEDILEEAMVFTRHYLLNHISSSQLNNYSYLEQKVTQALKQPIHKGVTIIEARHYISIYENKESKNELLLGLAKLSFNLSQNLYKKELNDILKWWKELDLITKLPYLRDRIMECYFWAVGIHFEPQYSLSRLAVTKNIALTMVLNDTYGHYYATLEELETFTESLQRWDIKEIDRLPNYMKIAYKVVLNVYEEYDRVLSSEGRSYAVSYAIETMKLLARGYHKTAKWYKGQEMPTFQDHISNAFIVGGYHPMLAASLMAMESSSEEAVDWLKSDPKILKTISLFSRYMNDRASYDREHKAGQFPTSVDCFMKEKGMSRQETLDMFLEFAEVEWKNINKDWLVTSAPRNIKKFTLNCARVTYLAYKGGEDGFTSSEKVLEQDILALFVNPIPIN